MLRFGPSRWVLMLTMGLWAIAAQAQEFRYRYVSFDQVKLPPGFTRFFPAAIHNSGRVYGTVCDDLCSDPHIAFYQNGTVTARQSVGFTSTVNARGTVGGSVLIDPTNFFQQAALFRGDQAELIAPQPGEITGFVIALNDRGTALVESDDTLFRPSYLLYSRGQTTPLNFGPTVARPSFVNINRHIMNNQGIIAGTEGDRFNGARGFRFDPRTGETKLLNPLPTESIAWGISVNNRGDVLGYSFNALPIDSGGIERIGVWDRNGKFKTYFVEGNPEFPTISNFLVFNDDNLIVITLTATRHSNSHTSYLVPKPGVRLNLADLVENLPEGQDLRFITDMNNHGSMIGSSSTGNDFLLERIDIDDH
jgi:hypothetical protein